MEFANVLKEKRKERNLTQQELADEMHVTRQTLSRWENNLSYPNLDTLVRLSIFFDISLDTLLKGEDNLMVAKISHDVRDKKRYKRYLSIIAGIVVLVVLLLSILGYGRATQNELIDYFNPFLKIQYGYTVLPNKISKKREKVTDINKQGVKYAKIIEKQKIDAFVADDPFGNGNWLKFYTGTYKQTYRWAIVEHKGSYVYAVRLIKRSQIPSYMREQAGSSYVTYNSKAEPRVSKKIVWWPFD